MHQYTGDSYNDYWRTSRTLCDGNKAKPADLPAVGRSHSLSLRLRLCGIPCRPDTQTCHIYDRIVQNVSRGNISERLENAREDELGVLADSFNTMLENLEESIQENNALERKLFQNQKIKQSKPWPAASPMISTTS